VFISDSLSTRDLLKTTGWKKSLPNILCLLDDALFFSCLSYDNVQKCCILFQYNLIFQSKCVVILAS